MAYGLELFDQHGHLVFSTESIAYMVLDRFAVAANGTSSTSYPVATGWEITTQVQMVNNPPDDQEAYAPEVTVSGTNVTVAPFTGKTSEETIVIVLARDI